MGESEEEINKTRLRYYENLACLFVVDLNLNLTYLKYYTFQNLRIKNELNAIQTNTVKNKVKTDYLDVSLSC